MKKIKNDIEKLLRKAGVEEKIEFTIPPNVEMGDVAFGCFGIAKAQKKSPAEVAKQLHSAIRLQTSALIERIEFSGPYINFFLNENATAKSVLKDIDKQKEKYGAHKFGKRKKVLVEYGCPNPLKAFHLGHLKNLITGESVARILGNGGYAVKRVNYQGDVGMHVAKALWGIQAMSQEFEQIKDKPLQERVEFLGRAYAYGATHFENDAKAKAEITLFNERVYAKDPGIQSVYQMTRQWSLDYFDTIYTKLGTAYDRMYFESEVVTGKKIVETYLRKGVFIRSDGAIVFSGSKYGLHDRVFVNSQGYPTYEAKELALAKLHFAEYSPDQVIHVVGKEQTEYFKVVFKALGIIMPKTQGKEFHLIGGYLQLKGEKKMSSRTGNIITGDALIAEVEKQVDRVMAEMRAETKAEIRTKVTVAALKYAMLKSGVSDDIAFDMATSISTHGDSGPYLLYIVARIKSILEKSEIRNPKSEIPTVVEAIEKQLVLKLAAYPEVTKEAAEKLDPSKIAHYLLELAQTFNSFYEQCPVLQVEESARSFRLRLIKAVEQVMTSGLWLLGIETVEEM